MYVQTCYLRRHTVSFYQGTPTYAIGITPVPLHRGAYQSLHKPYSVSQTNASPCVRGGGPRQWWKGCKDSCVRRRKLPCSGGVGTACGGGGIVKDGKIYRKSAHTYNPSVTLSVPAPLTQGSLQMYVQTCYLRRHTASFYQGTPTYAIGITPVPLHRGSLTSYAANLQFLSQLTLTVHTMTTFMRAQQKFIIHNA